MSKNTFAYLFAVIRFRFLLKFYRGGHLRLDDKIPINSGHRQERIPPISDDSTEYSTEDSTTDNLTGDSTGDSSEDSTEDSPEDPTEDSTGEI